ncbi:Pycsar system effector family protein [Kribbella sp. NPDC056951]|uniref:Pycsar system effector family protein n=1 Tax=Kribbella sp. NPDC056951 TaxID=3345978 RepID=UPI00364198AE
MTSFDHANQATQPVEDGDLTRAQKVHDLVAGSIGKADAKAGFVATLNTAVLAGVVALVQLDHLGTAGRILVSLGLVLMVAALLCAVAVVLPILRARHTKHGAGSVLYFGTVRHYTPDELADRLAAEDTVREVCAQSVILSRLSWRKHRLLQASMLATIAGATITGLTLLMTGGAL